MIIKWQMFLFMVLLVGLGVVSRVGWVIPNFSLVGSLALWGKVFFKKTPLTSLSILLILFLSDLVLGFYPEQPWVYLAYLPYVALGAWGNRFNLMKPILGSLGFFLISNFGVWMSTPFYPKSFEGLLNCYQMGIPFYKNTLLSDVFYYSVFGLGITFHRRWVFWASNATATHSKR